MPRMMIPASSSIVQVFLKFTAFLLENRSTPSYLWQLSVYKCLVVGSHHPHQNIFSF
jgi:hypothetical protein